MQVSHSDGLYPFLKSVVGTRRTDQLFNSTQVPELPSAPAGRVTRSELAMALALLLFEDVCTRVPVAGAYVTDLVRSGQRLLLDHGALRTVDAACGALPPGREAFDRILRPLGYRVGGTYPLEKLAMTGHAYVHAELPEEIPQYFVSELHPDRFSHEFQAAVGRVVGNSHDPLPPSAMALLEELASTGSLPLDAARQLLPELVACFDRQHDIPTIADYEQLAEESQEMAWIATEGQAFNHATDRVDDVGAVADRQRRLGRPIKDKVEISANARVNQTAFRAAMVERMFIDEEGEVVLRTVPGSFHEFITRRRDENGDLDLTFDSSNAQGIFVMTRRENV